MFGNIIDAVTYYYSVISSAGVIITLARSFGEDYDKNKLAIGSIASETMWQAKQIQDNLNSIDTKIIRFTIWNHLINDVLPHFRRVSVNEVNYFVGDGNKIPLNEEQRYQYQILTNRFRKGLPMYDFMTEYSSEVAKFEKTIALLEHAQKYKLYRYRFSSEKYCLLWYIEKLKEFKKLIENYVLDADNFTFFEDFAGNLAYNFDYRQFNEAETIDKLIDYVNIIKNEHIKDIEAYIGDIVEAYQELSEAFMHKMK